MRRHDGFNFGGARVRNMRLLATEAYDLVGSPGSFTKTQVLTGELHTKLQEERAAQPQSRDRMAARYEALQLFMKRAAEKRSAARKVLPEWLALSPELQAARFPPAKPELATGAAAPIPGLDASSWTAFGDKYVHYVGQTADSRPTDVPKRLARGAAEWTALAVEDSLLALLKGWQAALSKAEAAKQQGTAAAALPAALARADETAASGQFYAALADIPLQAANLCMQEKEDGKGMAKRCWAPVVCSVVADPDSQCRFLHTPPGQAVPLHGGFFDPSIDSGDTCACPRYNYRWLPYARLVLRLLQVDEARWEDGPTRARWQAPTTEDAEESELGHVTGSWHTTNGVVLSSYGILNVDVPSSKKPRGGFITERDLARRRKEGIKNTFMPTTGELTGGRQRVLERRDSLVANSKEIAAQQQQELLVAARKFVELPPPRELRPAGAWYKLPFGKEAGVGEEWKQRQFVLECVERTQQVGGGRPLRKVLLSWKRLEAGSQLVAAGFLSPISATSPANPVFCGSATTGSSTKVFKWWSFRHRADTAGKSVCIHLDRAYKQEDGDIVDHDVNTGWLPLYLPANGPGVGTVSVG